MENFKILSVSPIFSRLFLQILSIKFPTWMENFKILSVRPIFSRLFLPTIRTVATTPKKSKNNSMIKIQLLKMKWKTSETS